MDKLIKKTNLALVVGTHSWRDQFMEAITVSAGKKGLKLALLGEADKPWQARAHHHQWLPSFWKGPAFHLPRPGPGHSTASLGHGKRGLWGNRKSMAMSGLKSWLSCVDQSTCPLCPQCPHPKRELSLHFQKSRKVQSHVQNKYTISCRSPHSFFSLTWSSFSMKWGAILI